MIDLIKQNRQTLEALCRKYRVGRLELFGSAAAGDFDRQSSDVDFLVEFLSLETGQAADNYFGLLFDLQDLFSRPVDLVMEGAIKNPYFLEAVKLSREPVYAA